MVRNGARPRVAALTAISRHKEEMSAALTGAAVGQIIGRLNKIVEVLREKNIYLLPGGTLEGYLPKYKDSPYDIKDELKKTGCCGGAYRVVRDDK